MVTKVALAMILFPALFALPPWEASATDSAGSNATSSVPARPAASPNARAIVTSVRDLQGSFFTLGTDKVVQIVEVAFGANSRWDLTCAYLKYVDSEGVLQEWDNRSNCQIAFRDISDIHGVFVNLPQAKMRVFTDEVSFGISRQGSLSIVGLRGQNEGGELVNFTPDFFNPICAWIGVVTCLDDVCANNCPPSPPCTCKLPPPAHCDSHINGICPGLGVCAAPTTCTVSGSRCDCF